MTDSQHRPPAFARRRPAEGMRVLVILPAWSRVPAAGAFISTREYTLGLAAAGHTVHVVTSSKDPGEPYTDGGVSVWPLRSWRRAVRVARPELLISHHGDRRGGRIVAQTPGVPHLLMVHGMSPNLNLGRPRLVWYPSRACRDHYPYRGRSVVLPPPVDPDRYRTTPGGLVTLNGTTAAKGADVLAAVAEQMPDRQFLAVRTPWHDAVPLPGNVEVIDRAEPREVYARTRLLLMPSQTESWGRVGVEAMVSGIPVLAAPLPGIREALGTAARYVARDDIAGWVAALRYLDDPGAYTEAAARARAHTDGLDYAADLRAFEQACRTLTRPAPARRRPRPAPAPAVPARRPAPQAVTQGPPATPQAVAWVHYGVPYRRAGSETMLHTMMRALHDAGVPVLVVCSDMPEAPVSWAVDGVPYAQYDAQTAEAFIRSARPRVVVTHHDYAPRAVRLARDTGARSVLLMHSDLDIAAEGLTAGPDLCVYNTEWIVKSLARRYPQVDQIGRLVVRPPVVPGEHQAPWGGTYVTLVNLNRHKGVDTWRGAARLLPGLPFLGVTGAHGPQVTRPLRRNMRVIPQTSDMRRDVWARTRVLMVPSVYESYGMAAVEALASDIPVIAHPAPGLREALGDAAVFVDRDDHAAWATTIRTLYRDGPRRARLSAAARARSALLAEQSRAELATWVDTVRGLLDG
ncbi:glycosyltransferase family 4 protein [Streptomyces antimycoticus]|uniref:glycosyltransferase family 4 protein n=1 Tax=Streptomyces antimycoticus TaxID=68175 RepID=UPI003675FA95